MKKIRVIEVAALLVVTLGFYSIAWFVKRRNEIVDKYGIELPRGRWMVITPIAAIVAWLTISIILLIASPFGNDADSTATAFFASLLGAILAAFAITLWWVLRFVRALRRIIGGRIPRWWTPIFYFFLLGYIIPVYQYHINHFSSSTKKLPTKQHSASPRFLVLSAVFGGLFLALEFVSAVQLPGEYKLLVNDIKQSNRQVEEAKHLFDEYDNCIAKLDNDFPGDLTAANASAYEAAYAKCEEIRQKQNAVVDKIYGD